MRLRIHNKLELARMIWKTSLGVWRPLRGDEEPFCQAANVSQLLRHLLDIFTAVHNMVAAFANDALLYPI